MPASPLTGKSSLVEETTLASTPLLPTVVAASYKGGVWKTTLAVALAERLAWAGLRVLLVTCDDQEDARSRLGVTAEAAQVAKLTRGEGTITVLGARNDKAIDLLYRRGPEKLGLGAYDIAVVDTPPQLKGGMLPGVLMLATVDGTDAARNLVSMLRVTPPNSKVVLIKVKRDDPSTWAQNVNAIEKAAGREVTWLKPTLPLATPIRDAHNDGRSVWTLPRRGCTLECLDGFDILAQHIWTSMGRKGAWPPMPSPAKSAVHVAGWDPDDHEA
jgi:cellulose biosynthesis protein BcsQ